MLVGRARSPKRGVHALKYHACKKSRSIFQGLIEHSSFMLAGRAGSLEWVVQALKSHACEESRKS